MGLTSVSRRLLWKEFRESILVAVLCFLLPVAGFKIGTSTSEWVAAMLTPLGVFVWAAAKANTRRQRREFEATHLPLPAAEEWLASFLFPAIMAALIGANYGYWGSSLGDWKNASLLVPAATLYTFSGFAVCYVLSTAFALVPAVLVAVAWLIPAVMLQDMFKDQSVLMEVEISVVGPLFAFLWRGVIGGALGSLVFSAPFLKRSQRARQALALLLALGVPLGPFWRQMGPSENPYDHYTWTKPICSPDGSLTVRPHTSAHRPTVDLEYSDFRRWISRTRSFPNITQAIGFVGRGVVYLAQQTPGDKDVAILAWDVGDDSVREVARLPAGRDAMAQPYGLFEAVSPDGRYVLIRARSKVGDGQDLWLVDGLNGTSAVILPNTSFGYGEVRWLGEQAIVAGEGKAVEVQLGAMKARSLDLLHRGGR